MLSVKKQQVCELYSGEVCLFQFHLAGFCLEQAICLEIKNMQNRPYEENSNSLLAIKVKK